MKIGLQINQFSWPREPKSISKILTDIATTADQGGFSSIWVMDHFFQIWHIGKPEEPMLEAYTTLGFLAGITKKAMLGTMVTGVIYRYPALLIKAVTALDVLSEGRAYFGIGAAWNEEESEALGFNFPPLKIRFEQLEDTLLLAKQMWNDDAKKFKGKQFTLPHPINHPQALQKPHPPILIGGVGEKKTLKFVAKYADACNLFARLGEDELKRKLDILREHCKDAGRNYDDIEKTCLDQVQPDFQSKDLLDTCTKMKKLGFSHIIIGIPGNKNSDAVKRIAEEVIPKVSKL